MNKIIKFSADWCGPCRAMAPEFKKLQEAHRESGIEILDVNVDTEYDMASQYGVRSIPHTVFIKEGEVVERITGIANYDRLNEVYGKTYLQ